MATKKSASKSKSSSSKKSSSTRGKGKVEKVMREYKEHKLTSGRSGKKVTNRKQAIAIGLSEAREAGAKIPKKKGAAKKSGAKKKSSAAKKKSK